ncbi:Conserved_hypothetical protein [Hexamita inflata]|uniref:Uncharacterized protein n=1 Tax=Hexamita inflata TaxID=28002 RepID=A0AA86QUB3_9EUKA|nr:Conserved hypothetical protein [Hexamita inflata]
MFQSNQIVQTKTMPALKFTADKLCFNLSFYDEQCINKLNVYFPENYIGNNQFAPKDSLYTKGVKINSSSSKILANFLQNEYVFGKTEYPTYQNIFQEPVSSAAFFVFALAQQQSFDNLQLTYNFIKQKIDGILYVGRTLAPGILSIFPDNKLTSKTVKLINNISTDSIISNVIQNTSIAIKEFDCEFYTETGIIVDIYIYRYMYIHWYTIYKFFRSIRLFYCEKTRRIQIIYAKQYFFINIRLKQSKFLLVFYFVGFTVLQTNKQ